jgi:hypothetical protein
VNSWEGARKPSCRNHGDSAPPSGAGTALAAMNASTHPVLAASGRCMASPVDTGELPARTRSSNHLSSLPWRNEQLGHRNSKTIRQPHEGADRQVLSSRLDTLEILDRYLRHLCKLLLREVGCLPDLRESSPHLANDAIWIRGTHGARRSRALFW